MKKCLKCNDTHVIYVPRIKVYFHAGGKQKDRIQTVDRGYYEPCKCNLHKINKGV